MSGENGVVALLENGDSRKSSSYAVKVGLAQMLRGRVILDVGSVQEARIAEEVGAITIMAMESIGQWAGVNRMSDPGLIREIKNSVNIPVISRVRIGHFVEGQILEAISMDFIDKSEVLTPIDDGNFINKYNFHSPYVCGCRTLGEGLRRIAEGMAMLRTEENANQTGDVVEAVRNMHSVPIFGLSTTSSLPSVEILWEKTSYIRFISDLLRFGHSFAFLNAHENLVAKPFGQFRIIGVEQLFLHPL